MHQPGAAGVAGPTGARDDDVEVDGEVVTPEAVALAFDAAGVATRGLAVLVDLVVMSAAAGAVLTAAWLVGVGAGVGLPDWVGAMLALLLVFVVFWGYPIAFESLWGGRTPGKAAMGLRVVTREGAPVGLRHAAIRAAFALVDLYATVGALAVLTCFLTRSNQRLGDLVAGTIVLRERTAAEGITPARFHVPQGLEGYAATIDAAALTERDYAVVRRFLLRAGQMPPGARAEVARRIATPLVSRLGHRPPAGVTPETFLLCLAARRQQHVRRA